MQNLDTLDTITSCINENRCLQSQKVVETRKRRSGKGGDVIVGKISGWSDQKDHGTNTGGPKNAKISQRLDLQSNERVQSQSREGRRQGRQIIRGKIPKFMSWRLPHPQKRMNSRALAHNVRRLEGRLVGNAVNP